MAQERIIFPTGQNWLIERMETLVPQVNKSGVYFAFANMAMQASFSDDLKTFEKRLETIYKISVNEFKTTIENLEKKRLAIIKQVKDEIGPYRELNNDELIELINDVEIKEKFLELEAIVKEKKLAKEQEEAELKKRKEFILFNAFVQKKIDKKILELPEEEQLTLDIRIFFQNNNLYQSPTDYSYLFKTESESKQDTLLTLPLTASKKIKSKDISEIKNFSGVYTENEMIELFESFSKTFEEFTPRITSRIPFILTSSNSTITIIYDPYSPPKNWLFINADQLESPIPRFTGTELASKITSAFSKNEKRILTTKIYSQKSNENTLKEFFKQWEKNESFKKIHSITADKLVDSDLNNATWLYIAARHGQTKMLKKLLKAGANPDLTNKNGTTPLCVAAYYGHTEIVEILLNTQAFNPNFNLDLANNNGTNPLNIAAERGYTKIVEKLLYFGANPNTVIKNNAIPLFIAAQNGHTKIVKELLKFGADPNWTNNEGATPLYIAAQNGHIEIVEILLYFGANPVLTNKNGTTPLCVAAYYGHTKIVEKLLRFGANPNLANNNGTSPLYMAAQNGHTKTVELLLNFGAKHDVANNNRNTALYIAAQNGHTEIVKELLKFGADPNWTNNEGATPLYIAAKNGHTKIVEELLYFNSKYDLVNNDGNTPLYIAAENGHTKIVEKLLNFGANPNLANKDGKTPLYTAAVQGHTEIVELILKAGPAINPDLANKNDISPLLQAVIQGHTEIVEKLLKAGANPNWTTKNGGFTPLCIAAYKGHTKIVKELLKFGADPNSANNEGITPLCAATLNGHTEIVAELLKAPTINPDLADNEGDTPLYIAKYEGHKEIFDLLLKAPAINSDLAKARERIILPKIIFPPGQRWLIERIETLVPQVEKEGGCFGVANMAMQAVLADDLETFEKRLEIIHKIPVSKFKATVENLEQKRLAIVKQVKDEVGPYRELKDDEVKELINDEEIKEKFLELEAIINEKQLSKEEQEAELKRQKEIILFNAFIQKKIDKKILELPEEERLTLDIPIFFQNHSLYQTPARYSYLFDIKFRPTQDTLLTLPLTASKKFKPSDISEIRNFSGVYNKNELIDFFESFNKTIEEFTPRITNRIVFNLTSSNHAITVIYDPHSPPKNWICIDANRLESPTPHFTASELASRVNSAFLKNEKTIFATKIYTHKSNESTLNEFLTQWEKNETFKKIHRVTADKTFAADSNKGTWLFLAALNGQTKIIQELLNAGAKPDLACKDDNTPLCIAASKGYIEIVKLLLNFGAKHDLANKNGITPLYIAAHNGHTKIVEELLKFGADPNSATKDAITPLYAAAEKGYSEVVEELLKVKTNLNFVSKQNATPLFVAAQQGHKDIVLSLLANGASHTIALKSNSDSLTSFAKERKVEKAMQTFIDAYKKEKNIDSTTADIYLTPKDIAEIMGHKEIAELLVLAEQNEKQNISNLSFFKTKQVQAKVEKEQTNEAKPQVIANQTPSVKVQ